MANVPVWKQMMIVLLMLFPIVMLELIFLSPYLSTLHFSLATFIGNAISVALLSWPFMSIAIYCLNWWLTPINMTTGKSIAGALLVIGLYVIEVVFFWYFF